jgi:ABC-type antimicrobial peptide transport system permease subunit
MFWKNLLRRKVRTLLTVFGISIGVAAVIAMGAMTDSLGAGYTSMLTGAKADLILSQPDAFDPSFSSVDETVGQEIANMPEVSEVSAMIQGFANAEGQPFIFVFGYQVDSYAIQRYVVIEGDELDSRAAQQAHGRPILLGKAAAEVMKKDIGDSIRLVSSVYRVVGVYQTGDTFEDSGVVMGMADAQELLGKPRKVSLFYIRLKDTTLRQRFITRFERLYDDLDVSGVQEFTDKQVMKNMLGGFVWAIGGLAILIGGIGMMNAQLMSIMERTREIGTLRALGWSRARVLRMILLESISVCLLGGLIGLGLGYGILVYTAKISLMYGSTTTVIQPGLLARAFALVGILGLLGGLYPAWRAARMQPIEALRYEGGSGGKVRRLPIGGMAMQSLWQRSGRTFLTLIVISITVGAIMSLQAVLRSFLSEFSDMLGDSAEVMVRQADISDTELSVIDEQIGKKIAAIPDVAGVSGIIFTAAMLPNSNSFFILWGYAPNEYGIQRFRIVEGETLTNNHQVIIGRFMANMLKLGVGDTLDMSGTRFRIVGIFESNVSWEELGGVVSLRDAQIYTGRPRKVGLFAIKLRDKNQAQALVGKINQQFPGVYASLAGEFVSQMPDMNTMNAMTGGISVLSILVGGVGVLNTMLMSVFERTREIGVFRALGWRRRKILGMILREATLLGLLGGFSGILVAFGLVYLIQSEPSMGGFFSVTWEWDIFARAIGTALILGLIGGIYPAYRATRLQPVEALRYE